MAGVCSNNSSNAIYRRSIGTFPPWLGRRDRLSQILAARRLTLSADKDNGYRSRFDLAHEIAHVVLHRHIQRTTDSARHKLMEQQAHRFAGAFLLPAETFAPEVRVPPTLDHHHIAMGLNAAVRTRR